MRPQTSSPPMYSMVDQYGYDGKSQAYNIHQYRPKFYVSKAQQDSNLELMKGVLRDAPNSREFKKTIPKQMPQDKERLYEELNKSKTIGNQLKLENYQLRVQIKAMESVIQKQCSINDDSKDNLESYLKSASVSIPLSRRQFSDVPQQSITIQLKKQLRGLKDELDETLEDMMRLKRNAKLTRIQETETELKSYKDECARLRTMLNQELLNTANPTKTEEGLEQKYLQQQDKYIKLQYIKNNLDLKFKKISDDYKRVHNAHAELENNFQKAVKEKTQLKKQLQDLEEQFNKASLNDPLFKRGQDVTQIKLEFEKKLIEANQLKNDNFIKDRKIHELDKQLKEITNTYQEKLNAATKEKEQWKDKADKQKIELIELQDKYQQLFFNSNRNLASLGSQSMFRDPRATQQSMEDISPQGKGKSQMDQIDESRSKVQFTHDGMSSEKQVNFKRKLQRKLSAIKVDDIDETITQLRYNLRSQNIRSSEIELYIFVQSNKDQTETTIGELAATFQKKPFNLNQNESVAIARYLIEPYGESEIQYNLNLSKDNDYILQTFIRAIGKYNIHVGDDKISIHESIRTKLNEKKEDLMNYLKPKKSQQIVNELPGNLTSRSSFKTALLQTSLDEEETDILMQTIFEITQDFSFVDLDIVWETWPLKGQLVIGRSKQQILNRDDQQLEQVVQDCLDGLLNYAQDNNLTILDLRRIMDQDGSGHVERNEMKEFLKKCEVNIDEMQLVNVIDHFDIEGDGRISTNDVGNVLKQAQLKRQQQLKEQGSHKKTPKQLLTLVAQNFLQFMNSQKQDLFQIFQSIDTDGEGSISRDEFKQMLRTKIIIPLDQDEYNEFFKLIDHTNDGMIHFQEFQQHMIPEIEKLTGKPYHEHLKDQYIKTEE